MKKIENVEIFKVGEVSDSMGHSDVYTEGDLEEIVNSYNKENHEAPIVIGHDSDKNWSRLVTSRTQLANGWVSTLKVIDSTLMADIEVDNYTYDAIKSGKLKKRSIGLYPRNSKHNPTKGKFHLRHLALLGAEPPAIKGLADIKIYKEVEVMDESLQLLNEKSTEWLAFALIDGGNGFNGEIVSFSPQPSEDNNWLYNEETQEYSGKFEDDQGQMFDFTITKEGDDWITSIKMNLDNEESPEDVTPESNEEETTELSEESITEEETDTVETTITTDSMTVETVENNEDETASNSEQLALMSEQIADLNNKLKEYEERERANMYAESKTFCEEMYSQGYLTESQIKQEALYKIISALTEMAGAMTYSEGDDEVSVISSLKKLLKSFPKQLTFSDATVARAGEISFVSPYKNGTEESNREYSLIRKYMEKNNISDFGVGYREYRSNK